MMKKLLLTSLLSVTPVSSILADATVNVSETMGNQPIVFKPHTKDSAQGTPIAVKVGETVSVSNGKYDIDFSYETFKCSLKHFVLENDENYVVSVYLNGNVCAISVGRSS